MGRKTSFPRGIAAVVVAALGLSACGVLAPRPLYPWSTARSTSRRPFFQWETAPGNDGGLVEVCSDRPCTSVILTIIALKGTSASAPVDLPPGLVYWRLKGERQGQAGTQASAAWPLVIGARSAPRAVAWGSTPDLDGDGYADMIASANNLGSAHAAYLFPGGPQGIGNRPPAGLIQQQGASKVASVGDVNGDGYADIVIGSPLAADTDMFVYFGGPQPPAPLPLRKPGHLGSGEVLIAGIGDCNGDGYADFAAGAELGGELLILGRPSGPLQLIERPPGVPNATTIAMDGGDFNGDRYGDLIITEREPNDEHGERFRTRVFLGGPAGLSSSPAITLPVAPPPNFPGPPTPVCPIWGFETRSIGDVNGDGYTDVILDCDRNRELLYYGAPSGMAPFPLILPHPLVANGDYPKLAALSDADGDGFDDVAVSVPVISSPGPGSVFIYRGGPNGLGTAPAQTIVGQRNLFGRSAAGLRDVNGDGLGDLAVGAEWSILVYYGSRSGFSATPAIELVSPDGPTPGFGNTFGASIE